MQVKRGFEDVMAKERAKQGMIGGVPTKRMDRSLTKHVVTRWYRAPEVILFSQSRQWAPAIDMWSVGCILGELLQMVADEGKIDPNRQPLFPGRSCFPLSAKRLDAYKDTFDQLNCIFQVIGTPTPAEIEKIKDREAQLYLQKLTSKGPIPPCDLSARFPKANRQELDLLRRLLQFDVEKRMTVDQALEHPYLEDVRDLKAELKHPEVFCCFEDVDLDMRTIYELIVDEICHFNELPL